MKSEEKSLFSKYNKINYNKKKTEKKNLYKEKRKYQKNKKIKNKQRPLPLASTFTVYNKQYRLNYDERLKQ